MEIWLNVEFEQIALYSHSRSFVSKTNDAFKFYS